MKWNIPNLLTLMRVAVLPLIVLLVWPSFETPLTCFLAGIIYCAAGLLDVIDGYVARSTNQVTVIGKFLDPLADKLFYLVALIALLQFPEARVPGWVVMVVLVRELSITGLRTMAISEGMVMAAGDGGKMKTILATVGMVAMLFHYSYTLDFFVFKCVVSTYRVGLWITYLSLVYSLTSAAGYVRDFLRVQKQNA